MQDGARKRLLDWVLHCLIQDVQGKDIAPAPSWPESSAAFGLFVTLRVGSELRGCMGRLGGIEDLATVARDVAASALRDPRFAGRRIQEAEFPGLHVEISLLSPLRPIDSPAEIVLGQDGILLSGAGRQGLFLPQVALEQGWSAEELVAACCRHKMGLPSGAWRQPGFELSVFTTDVLEGSWAPGCER